MLVFRKPRGSLGGSSRNPSSCAVRRIVQRSATGRLEHDAVLRDGRRERAEVRELDGVDRLGAEGAEEPLPRERSVAEHVDERVAEAVHESDGQMASLTTAIRTPAAAAATPFFSASFSKTREKKELLLFLLLLLPETVALLFILSFST